MAVKLNTSGETHLRSLIDAGKYNTADGWDFSAEDGNALLGEKGDDWKRYASVHLGEDDSATENTKARWKYPAAKAKGDSEEVYRSGLVAAKQRAAQNGENDIEAAAGRLIDAIDKKDGKEAKPKAARARASLPHVMARIFDTPLLIEPQKLDVILSAIGVRLADGNAKLFFDDGGEEGDPASPDDCYAVTQDGIALIEVDGTLVYKSSWLSALSGMQSYSSISAAVQKACDDPNVKGILLMVGSNGGEAAGCFDCSDAIYAARAKKPVYGVAADGAYSGGYALLSAAEKVFVSRTGGVGSIGVAMVHVDQSQADKMEGLKYTYVYSGARKIDGNPHQALSPEARAAMQAESDRLRGLFAASVAKYRGLSVEAVLDTQAALFFAQSAVNAGLADEIGSPDQAYAALVAAVAARANGAKPALPRLEPVAAAKADAAKAEAANVVNLDDVRQAAGQQARALAVEIAELCALAGAPELAAGFIRTGKSIAQVREQLQMRRVDASEARKISGHILPDAGDTPKAATAGWEKAIVAVRGRLRG